MHSGVKIRNMIFLRKVFNRLLILALTLLSVNSHSQVFSQDWLQGYGSWATDVGVSICSDHLNNVYTCGFFSDTLVLNNGEILLSSNGRTDIYLMKQDSTGSILWAYSFGGEDYDGAWMDGFGNVIQLPGEVEVDRDGNVYLIGNFSGIVDFDPGPDNYLLNSEAALSGFVLKLDAEGSFSYAQVYKGSFITACITDSSNALMLAGSFFGEVDFELFC